MKNFINIDTINPFSKEALTIIQKKFKYHNKSLQEIISDKSIKDYNILFPKLLLNLNSDLLIQFESLEVIVSNTTGLNHIDLDYCSKHNIRVISLLESPTFLEGIHSSAEHTWGLLMNANKNISQAIHYLRETDDWNRNKFISQDLNGKNLGILGLGRNGRKISQYAKAFEMNISYFDKSKMDTKLEFKPLKDLLSWSDFLVISIPLSKDTKKLLDKELLLNANENLTIINTSRGEVVDEEEIIKLLQQNKLKHYATDVITDEINPGFLLTSSLFKYFKQSNKVTITPHIGGANYDSWEKTEIFLARKLIEEY